MVHRKSIAYGRPQHPVYPIAHSSHMSRGGGIRTHGLFVPNEARYQAAPHPVASEVSLIQLKPRGFVFELQS